MKKNPFGVFLLFVLAALVLTGNASAESLRVLAPSSMTDALDEAIAHYRETTGKTAIAVYASTAALAHQAAAGAPADLIITADEQWMDWLAAGDFVDSATRKNLFGNRLILIGAPELPVPSQSAPGQSAPGRFALIDKNFPLLDLLASGRMALAQTDAVPAGRYGKEALENLGFWNLVKDHIVETENVRAALALVRRGEARLGIVYASDIDLKSGIGTLGEFPAASHRAILYPGAVLRQANDSQGALGFLDYLQTDEGRSSFLNREFSLP